MWVLSDVKVPMEGDSEVVRSFVIVWVKERVTDREPRVSDRVTELDGVIDHDRSIVVDCVRESDGREDERDRSDVGETLNVHDDERLTSFVGDPVTDPVREREGPEREADLVRSSEAEREWLISLDTEIDEDFEFVNSGVTVSESDGDTVRSGVKVLDSEGVLVMEPFERVCEMLLVGPDRDSLSVGDSVTVGLGVTVAPEWVGDLDVLSDFVTS